MTIEENLKKNLLSIPNPPEPVGNYVAYNQTGNLIFISGQLPIDEKGEMIKGKVGKDLNYRARQTSREIMYFECYWAFKKTSWGSKYNKKMHKNKWVYKFY